MLAPASRTSFTRIYAAAVLTALTLSDNFNKDIIMNISENVNFHKPGSKNGYPIVKREQRQELIEKHREEIESLRFLYKEQNRMNQENWKERFKELESNLAAYEQELYEKDTQIAHLQNEKWLETSKLANMQEMSRQ